MSRLLKLCGLSLFIYLAAFSTVLDMPLSLGVLRLELLQKNARLAALPSPKLVILAGSNGPYSHSCVVLGTMLDMPCENAGIAVGIGLDDIFARYEPLLHAGDIVYMPMEIQQYTTNAAAYDAGVDGEFLLRHDRKLLLALPLPRIAGAGFCCTLTDVADALVEMSLVGVSAFSPTHLLKTEYNLQGDRIDNNLSARDPALLKDSTRVAPTAAALNSGYGAELIAGFVARETRKGVAVIGGMPVDYVTVQAPLKVMSTIAAIYTSNGGSFIVLPGQSHYPPSDFFNSEDHLVKPCQYMHSIFVAQRLAGLLHKSISPLPGDTLHLAAACPSADAGFAKIRSQ